MREMLPFSADTDYLQDEYNKKVRAMSNEPEEPEGTVLEVGDIPKALDIFYKGEQAFLPEGKTFDDLTPEELRRLKSQYRFSPFRPGIYQGITGMAPGYHA